MRPSARGRLAVLAMLIVMPSMAAAQSSVHHPHVAAAATTAAPQQPSLPDMPVGLQLAWLLAMLNAGAGTLTEADLTAHIAPALLAVLPPEQLLDPVLQLFDPPPGLVDCGGLLANQFVAGGQVVGEGGIGVAHGSIISASNRLGRSRPPEIWRKECHAGRRA